MNEIFRKWWEGTFTSHDNAHDSPLYFVGGYHKRHWSSKFAHVLVDFWMSHWQYIISTCIAVGGIVVAFKKL
jgi:hypothetical protein